MLDRLVDLLTPWSTNDRQDPVDFSSLDFTEEDLDGMSEELSLEEKAISNGKNEIPHSEATQLDGSQEEVRAAIKGRIGKVMAGYERRIKGLNTEIESCRVEDQIDRLQSADQELGKELSDLQSKLDPKIDEARASAKRAEQQLEKYRSKHDIQREADYPESGTFQLGLLAVVCVLEAFVNGFFFRRGLEAGIVGGAFIAFMLALVDVLVVFWLARYSVWSYYGLNLSQRIVGATATTLAFLWAGFYNLLTAHIREYLQANLIMQEATQQALDRFLSSPFGIEQADSLVLVILGIGFSVSAYYAGATWEEVLPYYGTKQRKFKERKNELRYWKEKYRQKATSLRDEKLEDVEQILREAEDKTRRLEELINVKHALLEIVSECVEYYRSAFKALVRRYRDINQRHRSTEPPGYFDEDPEIEFTDVEDYSSEREERILKKQKEKLSKINGRKNEIKSSIKKKHDEMKNK